MIRNIHFIWLGGVVPEPFQRNIDSFRILNPDWQILIWNEDNSGDLGLDMDWAFRVFPRKAGLSNAIRLYILQRYGGIYCDVDCLCRLPVDGLVQGTACAAFQDTSRLCNAVMYAEPNHPWINWQVRNMNRYEGYNPEWGPYLATAAPKTDLTIIPSYLVYPYRHDDPPQKRIPYPETIIEHQWEGSWL